jgi:SAM-dependent methyltransferase
MNQHVDLFDCSYSHFHAEVLARVRQRTFGEDFGQHSWTTADEYRRWADWLGLSAASTVLEVASGSGGPALFLARHVGCEVMGVDINSHGVEAAVRSAELHQLADRTTFVRANADTRLPFPDETFDAILCVDSANHFPRRAYVLKEWYRLLRPGGHVLFTDPVVITGPVSNEELAARSSIGYFLFTTPGLNERWIEEAGLELVKREDVSANAATVSGRWRDAREQDRFALEQIEGKDRYIGLQHFFATVQQLSSERRLSRILYLARKPAQL